MNTIALPPRQRDTINAIRRLTDKRGIPPTLAEISRELGLLNRMTVHQHVSALKKKGLIEWDRDQNRTIRLVQRPIDGSWIRSKGLIAGVPNYRWTR